jgi:hypothetical protein
MVAVHLPEVEEVRSEGAPLKPLEYARDRQPVFHRMGRTWRLE